ncbi:FAD binding domain-containing protein [Vararia minispora EC-137]|uniref:FAD binding domain-containing protein n=1 Tax=Vararia minispora EC-137 TaxID=1314806 RepID=A0ACB8QWX9_9AGAM|nr:FAD binding domain-containing protein [Vararia minispora EC-137]
MPKESNVDVLIIGAGPAGVMCANGLARAGVNVRIIDKRPSKVMAGQADGIQPRTLEVLDSYGLARPLLDQAAQMTMAAFYSPSPKGGIERIGRVPDVTAPTARFPYEATLHQGEIESIFLRSMRKEGLEVDRPIIPTALEVSSDEEELSNPNAYPVKVTLQHLDAESEEERTEVVRAKFVVGCDGAHSWVRKTCGINMDGEQTDFIWGVLDMVPSADTNFPDTRCKTALHSHNGSCMIIPREGDKIRLYIQLTDTDAVDPTTGRINLGLYNPARLMEVAKKSFEPYTIDTDISAIEWWTIYMIGQRVASSFSVHERVFIAGDACHTHSPKAGQGMNASMNDTHNLIWKLTHVLRGWADMSLLKTYEFERRKYAQDLIAFDKKFSAMFSGKYNATGGLSHEDFLAAFQGYGNFTSGVGIHYAPSPIVVPDFQRAASHLTIGQRLPPQRLIRGADARAVDIQDLCPADTRFKLFVFTGTNRAHQQVLADALNKDGALARRAREKDMLDVIAVCKGAKATFNWLEIPAALRPSWQKVLLDDTCVQGNGGRVYATYGISDAGALALVRPDGYVGTVAPLDRLDVVEKYFAAFTKV